MHPSSFLWIRLEADTTSNVASGFSRTRKQELAPNRERRFGSRGCRGVVGPVPQPLWIRRPYSVVRHTDRRRRDSRNISDECGRRKSAYIHVVIKLSIPHPGPPARSRPPRRG